MAYAKLTFTEWEQNVIGLGLRAGVTSMEENLAVAVDPAEVAFYRTMIARFGRLAPKIKTVTKLAEDELRIVKGTVAQCLGPAARNQDPNYHLYAALDTKLSKPFMDDRSTDAEVEVEEEEA